MVHPMAVLMDELADLMANPVVFDPVFRMAHDRAHVAPEGHQVALCGALTSHAAGPEAVPCSKCFESFAELAARAA